MSVDINDYIDAALNAIREQINAANQLMNRIWQNDGYDTEDGGMEQLKKLIRTASDSIEIYNNYNGVYDRRSRWCWGDYPGRYEVQCRLCEVQRLCAEETTWRNLEHDRRECFGKHPDRAELRCRCCAVKRRCSAETRWAAVE